MNTRNYNLYTVQQRVVKRIYVRKEIIALYVFVTASLVMGAWL